MVVRDFLIQHGSQSTERLSVVNVQIAKIQTAAQGIPQAFINLFFHEGFERFANHFGIGIFVPVRATHPDNTGIRVNLTGFLQLIQEGSNFRRARSPFAPKMTRSHAWAVCVTAMSFSSVKYPGAFARV